MKFNSKEEAQKVIAKDSADGIPCYCDDCRDAHWYLLASKIKLNDETQNSLSLSDRTSGDRASGQSSD